MHFHCTKSQVSPVGRIELAMSKGTVEEARALAKQSPERAEAILKELLATKPGMSEEAVKQYELALMELGALYRDSRLVFEMNSL